MRTERASYEGDDEMFPPFYKTIEEEKKIMRGRTSDELLTMFEKFAYGPKSKEILKEILEYESPGNLYFNWASPLVVERGKGSKVWDADGNEYIDFHTGFAVQALGHAHPKITEAIRVQCEKLVQAGEAPNRLRTDLSKTLVELTPGNFKKKVAFTATGCEAVEVSMRLARIYSNRPYIMSFHGAFHGRTHGAMTATSGFAMHYFQGLPTHLGAIKLPYPYCYRCPFGKNYPDCDMQCIRFIEQHFKDPWYGHGITAKGMPINNVAAFLVEPVECPGGYIVPPMEFLRELRRIATENNVLLIDDEIQTGWGRSGKFWACEHSGIEPDILLTAKAMGHGVPISANVTRAEILDELGPGGHGTTMGGTPLACAIALTVARIFKEEKIVEKAERSGQYLQRALTELSERHTLIGDVNGLGLLCGVEFVKDRKTKEPATREVELLQQTCMKNGLLIYRSGHFGNRFSFIPPLNIEEEQIDRAIEIVDQALKKVE
jgi:4-aminobutyrate aminotransferase-like enzyme